MFGSYAQVLRRPGAIRFTAAGFLARMQMSMAGLGSVMLLSVERGSFAVAGTVSAIYALSAAVIGPQISRLIDVFGQSTVRAAPAGRARPGHRRDDRRRADHRR